MFLSNNESGATAIEYGVIISLITIACMAIIENVGGRLTDQHSYIAEIIVHGESKKKLSPPPGRSTDPEPTETGVNRPRSVNRNGQPSGPGIHESPVLWVDDEGRVQTAPAGSTGSSSRN